VLLVPASNTKLVTLAAAAARLGWDYRFVTTVRATTAIDSDGTVRGDLVVEGNGDPTIGDRPSSAAPMSAIADAIWASGVRRVEGRVIGDDRAYADERLGAGWAWDDVSLSYAAPIGSLIYNENTAAVTIVPGPGIATAAQVAQTDAGSDLSLDAVVSTGPAQGEIDIDFERWPGSRTLRVAGQVPLGSAAVTRYAAVDNPTLYFAGALRAALIARGIVVVGPACDIETAPPGPLPPEAPVLARLESPPLSAMAARLMKASQNLYAETLLRAVGGIADRCGCGASAPPECGCGALAPPATAASGEAAIVDLLKTWGVDTSGFSLHDGSGMSRYNLVSASALVRLLERMYGDEHLRDAWLKALPVAGVDGTLERRMKGTPLEGRVIAKTGSLSGVRALSGYVQTAVGEWLAFSMLANNFAAPVTATDVDAVMERALERLVASK
jgi:serine-type D-Ala-D-Ala carboxypeptidase/endopeptidase (penicillin-binding protein 4)